MFIASQIFRDRRCLRSLERPAVPVPSEINDVLFPTGKHDVRIDQCFALPHRQFLIASVCCPFSVGGLASGQSGKLFSLSFLA